MADDVVRHLLIRLAENLPIAINVSNMTCQTAELGCIFVFATSAFPSIHASFLVRDTMSVGT